jgi:hypothetical protein
MSCWHAIPFSPLSVIASCGRKRSSLSTAAGDISEALPRWPTQRPCRPEIRGNDTARQLTRRVVDESSARVGLAEADPSRDRAEKPVAAHELADEPAHAPQAVDLGLLRRDHTLEMVTLAEVFGALG